MPNLLELQVPSPLTPTINPSWRASTNVSLKRLNIIREQFEDELMDLGGDNLQANLTIIGDLLAAFKHRSKVTFDSTLISKA